jgi:hypothetical protein
MKPTATVISCVAVPRSTVINPRSVAVVLDSLPSFDPYDGRISSCVTFETNSRVEVSTLRRCL